MAHRIRFSAIDFSSAVAPNWVAGRLAKQTAPGHLDGKAGIGLKVFAKKSPSPESPLLQDTTPKVSPDNVSPTF